MSLSFASSHRKSLIRCILIGSLVISSTVLHAQPEFARVGIVCPCSLASDNGETATVQFGLRNFEDYPTENLYATLAVTGYFDDEEYKDEKSVFLGTTPLNFGLAELEEVATATYEIELGILPVGHVYLELLIHEGQTVNFLSLVDSIWFDGETEMPFTSLSKREIDFLIDTDGDGVDDVNENFMNTDRNDPSDLPGKPVVDVLIAYESDIWNNPPGSAPTLQIGHIFAVTNFLFERSGSPVHFRVVGLLDENSVPELESEETFLSDEVRDQLQADYGADVVLAYHLGTTGLCGIAEDIGGWRGRGFIHPTDRAILTHVWLNPFICPINVTAHEIGHLMGLGHSYVQGAVGTYYWSRGHGVHNEFGTVMSYAKPDYNGIDFDKFSNPHEDCNGKPCGISHEKTNHEEAAHSVLSVNITKYQFASAGTPPSDLDVDGDGFAADVDHFPLDPMEWLDTDGDGYGDNEDAFPELASEWIDTDGDRIGDNADPDIDGDGILNNVDADPFESDVQTVRSMYVVSEVSDDLLGMEIVRTGDWNGDGLNDVAIAAPNTADSNGEPRGAVYLLSMAPLTDFSDDANSIGSQRRLASWIEQDGSAWVIHSAYVGADLGMNMAYLSASEESNNSGMLVVSSGHSLYLIRLDNASLMSFDRLDGMEDRQISLEYCQQSAECWLVGENSDFVLHGIVAMQDRDRDGISDFAVLGSQFGPDDVSLYLLTTSASQTFAQSGSDSTNALNQIVEDCSACFRIHRSASGNSLSLANLGDLTGHTGHELGVGIEGIPWLEEGIIYVLNTDLVPLLDTLDGSADRQVEMDNLIGEDLRSYKITSPIIETIGRRLDPVADIDGDDRPEIMLWTQFGPHIILTSQSLADLDELDDALDGEIALAETSFARPGLWSFGNLSSASQRSQAILNPTMDGLSTYFVAQSGGDAIFVPLDDLGALDHPEEERRDGFIDLRTLPTSAGLSWLVVTRGLRAGVDLSGMLPLDDLDDDGVLDFMFAAHTQNADRQLDSLLQVVHSSSLPTLDRSDGSKNGVVQLHNNLDDTDGDGMANLHDMDDDNDGALDRDDVFPLDANAIYDADQDGTANVIDAFPDNPFEDSDLDGDGLGDRMDLDIDGDGIENLMDEAPFDTDNDGLDNYVDLDDDNDEVVDRLDAFPLDAAEQFDSDGDGVGDNADLFVNDASEWEDFDLDGIGDNADLDDDNDGYVDTRDVYPFDPDEWFDSDGDGIGDNADRFPNNPFEWEDEDNDGLGDNLRSTGIATHRVESGWSKLDFSGRLVDTRTYYLGDYDLSGGSKILIDGANPQDARGGFHVLSSSDLRQLDRSDEQRNQIIQIGAVAQGNHSWELRGPRSSFGVNYTNAGAVADVDHDEIGDLIIGGALDELGKGAVYIVRGAHLANADAIDGTADGKINHTQCSGIGMCIVLQNPNESGLGYRVTSLNGLSDDGDPTVVISNQFSTEWPEEETEGIPMFYLLSSKAILQEINETQTAILQVDQLLEKAGTFQVYTEFPEWEVSPNNANVHQLADYDHDGAEDLLLELPRDRTSYFLSSSDIVVSDSDDGATDGRINISNVRNKPNSFRLEGFAVRAPSARTTVWEGSRMSQASQFVPVEPLFTVDDGSGSDGLSSIGRNEGFHFLVDLTELAKHDASDGNPDGIITNIETTDSNAWKINGVGRLDVCNGGFDDPATQIFAEVVSSDDPGFSLLTLGAMRDLVDQTADTGNTVNLGDAISMGSEAIWNIGLGSLGIDLSRMRVACAGDWDGDGSEDVAISLLRTRYGDFTGNDATTNATVILLTTGDLPALDTLDGTLDKRIDLSLLWRTDSDE